MITIRTLLILLPALLTLSCAPNVDFPKGTKQGYTSMRLINRAPHIPTPHAYQKGQIWIRQDIVDLCHQGGLRIHAGPAELEIAHLVVLQNNTTTSALREYFGSGLEAEAITDLAHDRGVTEAQETAQFNRAGLVIDIRETHSGKLIFRNYVKRDVLPAGTSNATRKRLIHQAVAETLAPFLR